MTSGNDPQAEILIRDFERAKSERHNFESYWQQIADLILPSRQFTTQSSPGERRDRRIYDATAAKAIERAAAGMSGMMINPATRWLEYATVDPADDDDAEIITWLQTCSTRALALLASPSTGFYLSAHENLLDLLAFGTAAKAKSYKSGRLRFNAVPLSSIYLLPDSEGNVHSVFYARDLEAWQAVEEFGEKNVAEKVAEAARDPRKSREKRCYVQCVFPRSKFDPRKIDAPNKPIASIHLDVEAKKIVKTSGFDRWPFITPRWSKASGEVFGRSPSMTILPDVGMLNAIRKSDIIGKEKAIHPPLIAQSQVIEGPINTAPNSIIWTKAGAKDPLKALDTGYRADFAEKTIEAERMGIEKGFWLDMMILPDQDRMTATEVMQRIQTRLVFMAPAFARLTAEWLQPVAVEVLHYMIERRMVPPPPQGLRGRSLQVDFKSMLAVSQRASEANTIQQYLADLAPLAQIDPTALQRIDPDRLAKKLAIVRNVPQDILRTDEEIAQLRQQQAQLQQAAQEAAIAKDAAAAAKSGAEALAVGAGG